MIPKKFIPSFFIFAVLVVLYVFGVEFSNTIIICMLAFWLCSIIFDLHTTFQRKELLQNEANPILSYLLEKTTIKKSIIFFITFEISCMIFLPMIYFWQIDFVFSGIFAVFAGTIHVFAGISNQKMIKDFDKKTIFQDS